MHQLLHSAEFWSAIAGAIVGGVIAFIVQIVALRAAKRDREADRKLSQQGLARSLLFKMVRIFSDFIITHRHIEQCCTSAQERNLTGELWQYVSPLANPPPLVHFTSDEMGMLLGLKDNDVFNSVVSLDEVHNSIVETVKLYKELRLELAQRFPAPMAWQGEMIMGALTQEQMLALRPHMINVESIIQALRVNAANDARDAGEVLDRLLALLNERLGLAIRFEREQV